MGYKLYLEKFNEILKELSSEYIIYAPILIKGGANFSDTDRVRYGQISKVEDIVFDEKSHFSFKEVLLPQSETLLYFTEDEVREAAPKSKGSIVFLRSCDLHAVKRMDDIYLRNGFEDYYYKRLRENTKFILMGCERTFENCFCVDMGTNKSNNYDGYIRVENHEVYFDSKCETFDILLEKKEVDTIEVEPKFISENNVTVNIPEELSLDVMKSTMWEEYNQRCIACGRCNFVCPTCTCFTMQDIFYQDNKNVGERRRVWSSCQVDGFTDMAGGHSFRQNKGQRMRFKVLHKVYDYKKKWGYHMCVGCGRCDDICPEYISFSNCINKLQSACDEVK